MVSKEGPNLTDYMAGALLGNGSVWMWAMILGYMPGAFSFISPLILWALTLMIYVSGGALASYLVCRRARMGHLIVALKLVAAEWAFSLIMMLSIASEPTLGQALLLLICFTVGGIIGAYTSLKVSLKKDSLRRTPNNP